MKVLYSTSATATSGREGRVVSEEPPLDLQLTPTGGEGGGTNPEQLFAAGYAACFGSALGIMARRQKVDPGPFTITAKVALGTIGEGAYGLAVELVGDFETLAHDAALDLMREAHKVCPYSNATRGNVEVALSVKTL